MGMINDSYSLGESFLKKMTFRTQNMLPEKRFHVNGPVKRDGYL